MCMIAVKQRGVRLADTATEKLLERLYEASQWNKDGAGLAIWCGEGNLILRYLEYKELERALTGTFLDSLQDSQSQWIVHLRYASVGNVDISNVQPFNKVCIDEPRRTIAHIKGPVYAHNGTLGKKWQNGRRSDSITYIRRGGNPLDPNAQEYMGNWCIGEANRLVTMGYWRKMPQVPGVRFAGMLGA